MHSGLLRTSVGAYLIWWVRTVCLSVLCCMWFVWLLFVLCFVLVVCVLVSVSVYVFCVGYCCFYRVFASGR